MKKLALFLILSCGAVHADVLIPLGRVTVTTAGTPVRITSNQANPTLDLRCNAIRVIRNVLTETGIVTIELGNDAPSPGDGITTAANYDDTVGVIAPPTSTSANSDAISTPRGQINGLNAPDYYLDAETSTEGAVVVCKQVQ